MSARLIIGDRQGKLLAELSGTIQSVTWRLSQVGEAKVLVSRLDPKFVAENFLPGNRAIIKFDNGLPDFGGVMDMPYDWKTTTLEITIHSAEAALGFAATGQDKSFTSASLGTIAKELVVDGNLAYELGIGIGAIYGGGMNHTLEYHFKNVLQIIRDDLCGKLSTYDFDVLPSIDRGRINFTFNFYEHKGLKAARAVLQSGANLTEDSLKEQGPIINHVLGAGDGQDWGPERPIAVVSDVDSVALYGRRGGAVVFTGLTSQSSVAEASLMAVRANKDPKRVATVSAINVGPYTFADYDVGDAVRVIMPKMGFQGFDEVLRLVGREYDPSTNPKVCRLVVQ